MSTIKLLTNDKVCYTVDVEVAKMSTTIRTMLEDLGMDDLDKEVIPLPNVSGDALEKIIEWAAYHKDDPIVNKENEDTIKNPRNMYICEWDRRFLQMDSKTLFRLVAAANYLEVKGLLELCCKDMVRMIKGKSIPEMREFFGFTQKKPEKDEANASCSKMSCDDSMNKQYTDSENEEEAAKCCEKKTEKDEVNASCNKMSCDNSMIDQYIASEKEEEEEEDL